MRTLHRWVNSLPHQSGQVLVRRQDNKAALLTAVSWNLHNARSCLPIFTRTGSCTMDRPILNSHRLKVFSGRANRPLAEAIARHLGDTLGQITLGTFPAG